MFQQLRAVVPDEGQTSWGRTARRVKEVLLLFTEDWQLHLPLPSYGWHDTHMSPVSSIT